MNFVICWQTQLYIFLRVTDSFNLFQWKCQLSIQVGTFIKYALPNRSVKKAAIQLVALTQASNTSVLSQDSFHILYVGVKMLPPQDLEKKQDFMKFLILQLHKTFLLNNILFYCRVHGGEECNGHWCSLVPQLWRVMTLTISPYHWLCTISVQISRELLQDRPCASTNSFLSY